MSEAKWYVVHTYSGYENKVKANIDKTIETRHLEDQILEVRVPLEEVPEIRNGVEKVVQRKMFPGYVLVEMIVDDRTWYVVRNTPGVTGFVGPDNKQPVPLSDAEVEGIMRSMGMAEENKAPRPQINLQLQQTVRLKSGPFADFVGVVSGIDEERGKIKVLVDMFGRETPVDIDYTQVEEVE